MRVRVLSVKGTVVWVKRRVYLNSSARTRSWKLWSTITLDLSDLTLWLAYYRHTYGLGEDYNAFFMIDQACVPEISYKKRPLPTVLQFDYHSSVRLGAGLWNPGLDCKFT
jgi:hypothetical protein